MTGYQKFVVALAAALGVAGSLAADGSITLAEGIAIAAAFVGALGVRQVANTEPDDRGAVDPGSLALGLLIGSACVWALFIR